MLSLILPAQHMPVPCRHGKIVTYFVCIAKKKDAVFPGLQPLKDGIF